MSTQLSFERDDCDEREASDDHGPGAPTDIRTRFERLQTLQSAWSALGRVGLLKGSASVDEAGARLDDQLRAIALGEASDNDDAFALEAADAKLDELEATMRKLASAVPLEKLRATLPAAARKDRPAVLALLDLMLIPEDARTGFERHLPSIDFLITLLCTDREVNPAAIRHDPVSLTPKLRRLSESVEAEDDARREMAEADFYAAAQFDEYDSDTLQQQKVELGAGFFSPRVLRAITTYNASRLQLSEPGAARAEVEPEKSEDFDPNLPIFESPAVAPLIDALRRRIAGDACGESVLDRVAWGLDLEFASRPELETLLASSGTSREKPAGAAILVGLLCRSLGEVSKDLPAIGISPEVLTSDWLAELSDTIAAEVSQRILSDGQQAAAELTELRKKFLSPAAPPNTPPEPAASPAPAAKRVAPAPGTRRKAKPATGTKANKANKAKKPNTRATQAKAQRTSRRRGQVLRFGPAVLVVLVLVAVVSFVTTAPDQGRTSLSNDQLAQISSHLVDGRRDGEGSGPSFVGTVGDSWNALKHAEREDAAIHLVAALQLLGARNIMIYDSERRVRIQVLGEGNIQIPSTRSLAPR